ncbi:MAG: asparagine synthase (glutamine-hydrolyzing), partial [Thermodesulfobacteriota bacterium]|nr:asparagine synthase (glutamine-hydrolyzing) [Thermodesulfobacteriota bacterium]
MCGIAGFWGPRKPADFFQDTLRNMSETLSHRGPDGSGLWFDETSGLGLTHRRLSIMDLSPAGAQPMQSGDGRLQIVFNGEVYNFMDLRQEMDAKGQTPKGGWRGHSDTEAALAAIQAWGLEKALSRFIGMFAFALWDSEKKELTLVRDRLGIKPLYYGFCKDTFVFGSQLNPLRRHPAWANPIDRGALSLFLRYLYIPSPHSIFENILKLEPGTHVRLTPKDIENRRLPEVRVYWSVNQEAKKGLDAPFAGTQDEAQLKLEELLRDAVSLRMISDVPLGAFLSGGVDSSLVTALMQEVSERPVKTFTIGFTESDYNEAEQAKAVAGHLKTEHTELYVTPDETRDVIPRLPKFFDEPFADSSQIPTCLISSLARKKVTVSLSGDGGDELFGGYNRYLMAPRIWDKLKNIPPSVRKGLSLGLDKGLTRLVSSIYSRTEKHLPPEKRHHIFRDKLQKVADALPSRDEHEFFHCLASWWLKPQDVVLGGKMPKTRFSDPSKWPETHGFAEWMMAMDQVTYLPGDILAKVDQSSMAVALEARVPILDHRVCAFAHTLPLLMKISNGQGKMPLRRILYKYVPKE